jgi:hypothetical protein
VALVISTPEDFESPRRLSQRTDWQTSGTLGGVFCDQKLLISTAKPCLPSLPRKRTGVQPPNFPVCAQRATFGKVRENEGSRAIFYSFQKKPLG